MAKKTAKKIAANKGAKPILTTISQEPPITLAEVIEPEGLTVQQEIQLIHDAIAQREPCDELAIAMQNLRKAIVWIDRS